MREAGDGFVSLVPRLGGHGLAFEAMLEVVIYVSSALLTTYSFGTSASDIFFKIKLKISWIL